MKPDPRIAACIASLLTACQATECHRSKLTWLADTFIAQGEDPDYGYQDAVLLLGFEKAYELTGDDKYLDWYQNQIDDHVVLPNGTIADWNNTLFILDFYRMGHNYIYLYEETGEDKYKGAADVVRDMLNRHDRSPSGGFWHQPQFPNQMWLDGIYMADSFYARYTHLFDADNATAWADILLQYDLIETHARNRTSGLLPHGWADGPAPWADPATGLAPHVWGRAAGWYFMALLEVLQFYPASDGPGRGRLLGYFRLLAAALKVARDEASGSWWQIMEEPYRGVEGNFLESSASAMFTFGMLKGVRLGYLESSEYLDFAKEAYESLLENFVTVAEDGGLVLEGTVDECNLADGDVDLEYYFSRPIRSNHKNGCGPFMLASYEWESWAQES